MIRNNKSWLLIGLLITAFFPFKNQAQETDSRFKNLGPQLFTSLIQGSVFADDANGNLNVYTVVRGRPAHFVGFDVKTQQTIIDVELGGTDGSWDVSTSSDGTVYIAGANGILYQHTPGTKTVSNLGLALPGEKVIWDLTAGKNAEIFGGTYPGCRVFRYHPKDGFSEVSDGPLVASENYTRSLVYDKNEEQLYAGIATSAALVKLDPKTGQKMQLLPEGDRRQEAIYHINLVNGLPGGDRVFGWLTGAKQRLTVVYNLKTKSFESILPSLDVKSIVKSPNGNEIYYSAKSKLYLIDYNQEFKQAQELAVLTGEVKASKWGKDGLLYLITASENLHTYDPKTKNLTSIKLSVPVQPIDIQSIMAGPDGQIWSGGYLAGGHASYNPKTGKTTQKPGLDQTEGMANLGSTIYFGIYAKARLYAFDTNGTWDVKKDNPKFLGQIPGQDRPFAVLGLAKHNVVLFGTVPSYGQIGGALVQYDVSSEKLETFEQVIKEQSIVTLVNSGDIVIGGSSIFGGLGGIPKAKEAKIFGWDPVTKSKTFEMVPVSGAMAITGLINGPDGNIWGFADGDLIVFDPLKQKVIKQKQLFKISSRPSHIWRSAFMSIHPNGLLYLAVNNKLYQINPENLEISAIADNVSLLTIGDDGTIYFRRSSDLWSFNP